MWLNKYMYPCLIICLPLLMVPTTGNGVVLKKRTEIHGYTYNWITKSDIKLNVEIRRPSRPINNICSILKKCVYCTPTIPYTMCTISNNLSINLNVDQYLFLFIYSLQKLLLQSDK